MSLLDEQINIAAGIYDDDPMPDLEVDDEKLGEDGFWTSGVEELEKLSLGDAYKVLGFPSQQVPMFKKTIISEGDKEPSELKVKWHQIIGILKIVKQAFKGEAVLLADAVGLGKTIQVAGAIATLAYFRRYFEKYRQFPGGFSKNQSYICLLSITNNYPLEDEKWQDTDGNIPDLPFLISTPAAVQQQFINELQKFIAPNYFDILTYKGSLITKTGQSRSNWMAQTFARSKMPMGYRIVVTTSSVSSHHYSAEIFTNTHVSGSCYSST
jgi:SNF2-related domain